MDVKLSKNLMVNLLLVLILILVGYWVYNLQMNKYARLQAQKEMEINKNRIIENISHLEKKMFSYKRLLYPKETSSLVNSITDIASKTGVQVNSIQPLKEEQRDYYTKISVNLNIGVRSYHNLGNFISLLEKSPEIFNAEIVNISSATERTIAAEGMLTVTLTVSTLIYKD